MAYWYLPYVTAAYMGVHFEEPTSCLRIEFGGVWVHRDPEERRQLRAYERRFDRALARSRRNSVARRRRRHGRQR